MAAVLFELQGDLIADATGDEFMGLRSAASRLRGRRMIDGRIAKELASVDGASALLMYESSVRAKRMMCEVREQIGGNFRRIAV